MKYIKFAITNYKGIPKIELDLNKQPQAKIFTLVGLNESGKTTVLEALYLFQDSIDKVDAHTLIPKSRQHGFSDTISIEATLEFEEGEVEKIDKYLQTKYKFHLANPEDEKKIRIRTEYKFTDSIPLNSDDWKKTYWVTSFNGQTKKSKTQKKLADWKKDAWKDAIAMIQENFTPKILYYPDFLFKFPEKIYLEKYEGEGKEQHEYRGVIQDILHSIDKNFTLNSSLLERMKNSAEKSYKDALDQLLLKMSSKLDTEILKKWDAIFGSGQQKEVNIKWDIEEVGEGIKKYYIELKIKQGSDSYSINDRSLGFRWFFSFLIFTAFRRSRSSDHGETLFLLDEPASNLHQRSQQKLLQSLDDIVSNCKLIYSTHSHHLINPKWLAGTYIIKNGAINYGNPEESDTTETEIKAILYKNFVAQYPNEEDHFKPILDALDYVPSKLEFVPSIVFSEGKNDFYTFKYIYEVILIKNKLNFYPGAGKDKYDSVFRLYLAWNRKFIALFDADKGGKDSKKRYQGEIGSDIINKVFCLNDIVPSWDDNETEDLFTGSEKIKIIQLVFTDHKTEDGYSKSKFNTAIQQLYINKQAFKFNKTTIEKFENIFNFLDIKLSDKT